MSNADFDCRNIVQAAFRELDALVVAGDGVAIQEALNLCHPVDTENVQDIGVLFQRHIDYIIDYIEHFQ